MNPTKLLAATATAVMVASSASAATLHIDNMLASWTNPVNGTIQSNNSPSATAEIRWGSSTSQSGYDFDVNSPSGPWSAGNLVNLGNFNHLNNPIPSGTSITQVDLELDFQADDSAPVSGGAPVVSLDFRFGHTETPNTGGGNCCNDEVVVSILNGFDSFQIGNNIYAFTVLGFSQDMGNTITTAFSTVEGQSNFADLYATFRVREIPGVPLPAGGWLLLAGLGGLGVMKRRKKTS